MFQVTGIAVILWNYIQASILSLCLAIFLLKLYTLLILYVNFCLYFIIIIPLIDIIDDLEEII